MGKILIIDDEIGPRESLRILLKNTHELFLADSVDAGLNLLKDHQPDLIILDIRMPGKSGIEGLKLIREIDPQVSVIMLTGFGALETAQEAIRHGANDYLKKPFDIAEIQDAIERNMARTHLERRRMSAMNDLATLNRSLTEKLQQKEQMAELGLASAEFAHDLRNPLTIVMGYCELLYDQLRATQAMGPVPGDTIEYLDIIEKNIKRCHELARMWQMFGKADMDRREPTALSGLIRDVVRSADILRPPESEPIEYHVVLDELTVMASPPQLMRVLHNLVTNAVQALSDAGGRIEVTCDRDGDSARIRVADNGPGIPAEDQDKVFERYYTTKKDGKGTGLGLSIAKKIIEDHQGMIQIRSEVNRGTEITVHLPLHPEPVPKAS